MKTPAWIQKIIFIFQFGYDFYKENQEAIDAAIDAGKDIWDALNDDE